MLAFDGGVRRLDAASLAPDDLRWAQDHVLMLSGLYGVLRPLDHRRAYRLEMGTPAQCSGRQPLCLLGRRPGATRHAPCPMRPRTPVVVNLASQEYFHAVDRPALKLPVIDCQFEDWKDGRYKIISFFAKPGAGPDGAFCD